MRTYNLLLLAALFVYSNTMPASETVMAKSNTDHVLSVEAPVKELLEGYLAWIHKHPQVMPNSENIASVGEQPRKPYQILWPTMDIYSPSGTPMYFSNDSAQNVEVIHALPRILPKPTLSDQLRPTLQEALAMFPELQPYVSQSLKSNVYTVFVINHPGRPACVAQDEAIQQLKGRVKHTRVRVIEVRLQPGK